MYPSSQARHEEIEGGSTLRPQALRSLCEHAAVELDVRWHDLPEPAWRARAVTAQGREVPASETLWMRSREVRLHAVDLDAGARLDDLPREVLARLLRDVVSRWRSGGQVGPVVIEDEDGAEVASTVDGEHPGAAPTVVSGPLPALVGWATGRAADRSGADLRWHGGAPFGAPRWL